MAIFDTFDSLSLVPDLDYVTSGGVITEIKLHKDLINLCFQHWTVNGQLANTNNEYLWLFALHFVLNFLSIQQQILIIYQANDR